MKALICEYGCMVNIYFIFMYIFVCVLQKVTTLSFTIYSSLRAHQYLQFSASN